MDLLDKAGVGHYKRPAGRHIAPGLIAMDTESLSADESPVRPEDLDEEDKVMLVFSYLWVLALVPFMVTRREYVRWHAKQGLILCGVACVVFFAVIFVGAILATVTRVFAWLFAFGLLNLVFLYMALALVCMVKALRAERWAIPFLGDLVDWD
jgi:uncharacterized membrane protein